MSFTLRLRIDAWCWFKEQEGKSTGKEQFLNFEQKIASVDFHSITSRMP